jgi:hypothetical protein
MGSVKKYWSVYNVNLFNQGGVRIPASRVQFSQTSCGEGVDKMKVKVAK